MLAHRPWLIPGVYAVALGAYAVALGATRAASPSLLDWIGTWPRVQLAIVVPCLVIWLVLAARAYLRPTDPVARIRSRWAALGAAAGAIAGLALFQVPELVLGHALVPVSWIGLIALPLPIGLAVGILRDRLFDIEVVLNRTLVYGALTLTVIALYVVVDRRARHGRRARARIRRRAPGDRPRGPRRAAPARRAPAIASTG